MLSRNTITTKEMLKAAGFAAAMLLAEYYLFSGGEEHGHHHHHHHHDHEHQAYIASLLGKLVGVTATALLTSTRLVIATASRNNSIVMGASEMALNYLSPGATVASYALRGLFGAGVSSAINRVVPSDTAQPASTRRPT
jgi:hypothetical protein